MISEQNTIKAIEEMESLLTFCLEGNVECRISAILSGTLGAILEAKDGDEEPLNEIVDYIQSIAKKQLIKQFGNNQIDLPADMYPTDDCLGD